MDCAHPCGTDTVNRLAAGVSARHLVVGDVPGRRHLRRVGSGAAASEPPEAADPKTTAEVDAAEVSTGDGPPTPRRSSRGHEPRSGGQQSEPTGDQG